MEELLKPPEKIPKLELPRQRAQEEPKKRGKRKAERAQEEPEAEKR